MRIVHQLLKYFSSSPNDVSTSGGYRAAVAWLGTVHSRVCQRGWTGQPWARNPKTRHFSWPALGRPSPPNPSRLSTGSGLAWSKPSLLLTGPRLAQPPTLTSLARPLSSIGQTTHFYQPGQAAPYRTVSDHVGPSRDRAVPVLAVSRSQPDTGTTLNGGNESLPCYNSTSRVLRTRSSK